MGYTADGLLYVARQVTPRGAEVRSELMRVDAVSGRVYATRRLGSAFADSLLAPGGLWVITTRGRLSWLWRFDPRSLEVRSRRALPGGGPGGTLALAGGWLWAGSSDRLDLVAVPGGGITRQIAVPGADGVDVAADASGRILLVSEGGQLSHVQRRDPRTGALLATSGMFEGAGKPVIGGIIDGAAWISQGGGNMGHAERVNVDTLTPAAIPRETLSSPLVNATNGIQATVSDRILWVTQIAGGPQRNYCGNPATGRPRVPLPFRSHAQDSTLVAISAASIYYIPDIWRSREELVKEPIDPRCRGSG